MVYPSRTPDVDFRSCTRIPHSAFITIFSVFKKSCPNERGINLGLFVSVFSSDKLCLREGRII